MPNLWPALVQIYGSNKNQRITMSFIMSLFPLLHYCINRSVTLLISTNGNYLYVLIIKSRDPMDFDFSSHHFLIQLVAFLFVIKSRPIYLERNSYVHLTPSVSQKETACPAKRHNDEDLRRAKATQTPESGQEHALLQRHPSSAAKRHHPAASNNAPCKTIASAFLAASCCSNDEIGNCRTLSVLAIVSPLLA